MKIGVNIRLSEVQALLIYSVIKNYKHIILNKKKIAQKYIEVCKRYKIPLLINMKIAKRVIIISL